jgi:hypothetical protein
VPSTGYKTEMRRGTSVSGVVDSKAEAVAELMLEVAQCFFRIRALGQKTGLVTSWGGGAFGFLRSLALLGPLADELAAEGLVEFIENPRHQRSKLVRLTPRGEANYRELNAHLLSIASTMGNALDEADIHKSIEIVRQMSNDVKTRSEGLS